MFRKIYFLKWWGGAGCGFLLLGEVWGLDVRASPPLLSMWLHTEKNIIKKSKCAGLSQEIGFSAINSSSLRKWRNIVVHLNECNKLDLTAAQCFWLVHQNDSSRWFAVSSSHVYAVLVTVLLVGLPKRKTAKLRHYPEWHTEHRWRCSEIWERVWFQPARPTSLVKRAYQKHIPAAILAQFIS